MSLLLLWGSMGRRLVPIPTAALATLWHRLSCGSHSVFSHPYAMPPGAYAERTHHHDPDPQ
eukprot:scaffold26796_cov30-Tisochrysis_lutea.AAC.2